MFIDTIARYRLLCERLAGGPVPDLTVDLGHMECMGEWPFRDHLHAVAGRIVNVHLDDMLACRHEHLPLGQGDVDLAAMLRLLAEAGYQGGIHVELPRDAETLQHRSGRTGRAGKKGTAVLVVPYPARRRVDGMLRGARINAEWVNVPGPADIRRNDHERLLTALMAVPEEIDDEDRALADRLLLERSPQDIAASLVRMHRAKMPGVEELLDNSGPPPRADRAARDVSRDGFDDTVWFRMDVGRRLNADPRWLLPLICRRGHVTKAEIGAIKIGPEETMFEIPRALAARFAEALHRTEGEDRSPEGGIRIIPADGPPAPQRGGPRPGPGGKPNRPVLVRPMAPGGFDGPKRGPRPGGNAGPRPGGPPQRGTFRQGCPRPERPAGGRYREKFPSPGRIFITHRRWVSVYNKAVCNDRIA
jgi:ATP-dependent RNA helicase DeaD